MQVAGLVKALASPWLSVAFFLLMGAAALGVSYDLEHATAIVLTPLVLLLLNLAAAIISNGRFRSDLPLLLFHLALLAFLALLLFARLSYFDGGVKLVTGAVFEGNYLRQERGVLHGSEPQRLRFANDGLIERTPVGSRATTTHNRVRWWDSAGRPHVTEIGDDRPLVLDGYRIYATSQRGFAPVLRWQSDSGGEQQGTVELPYTTAEEDWPAGSMVRLPGGTEAWVQLVSEEKPVDVAQREDLGAPALKHRLVLRVAGRQYGLQPGDTVDLPGGRLTYVRLGTWLGYSVTYDPTMPWLVATVVLAVASLLWYYARLWRRPRPGMANDREKDS